MDTDLRPPHGLVGVWGDQGTGKSFFYKALVLSNLDRARLTFVLDYGTRFTARPGLVVVRDQDPEAAIARAFRAAPAVVAMDEADTDFGSDHPPPKKSARNELVRYARNPQLDPKRLHFRRGPVSFIYVARRLLDVLPRLRSSTDVVFTGRLSHEGDLQELATLTTRPFAEKARQLPVRRFLRFDRT